MNNKIEILEQDKVQHIDDFYLTFKKKLEEMHTFPSDYMFKFIVTSEQSNIAKVHSIFEKANASFSIRDSKNGKYSSITVKTSVSDADDVVIYYRQVAAIEGVMML
ncbi:DUF493 domain-containing protein [Dysgonomonas sp. 521]|uniref:DUF493 domain-containing protein n=1 Tax=Dysgonomonas sp. 521 TaxID=2302932 RepID=UPI0013D85F99|nr:DUF493 domain-containing protein [Dysgonomonas sp. 521]NDV94705.1 DUF493 domain-containing protein [Dysgonomonas sp. 521]